MRTARPQRSRGTVASDQLVDVATQDLDRAERGIARGALQELDAMDEQRRSAETRRSQERQSSGGSRTTSRNSASIPLIRTGVARILNAAAEAVEEYLDIEEDEDCVPEIPEQDRYEGMRSKVDSFIAQVERSERLPDKLQSQESQASLGASGGSLPSRGQSLRTRGQSIGERGKGVPGVELSSTEHFNETIRTLGSQSRTPFARPQLQRDPIPAPDRRRLFQTDPLAFDNRSNTSFEIIGRDRVRDQMLSNADPKVSGISRTPHSARPPRANGNATRQPPRLSDDRPNRAFSQHLPNHRQDPDHRLSMGSAPSQGLGTIEEIRYGDAGQLVRRRIALPWKLTLTFGCLTTVGCLAGLTTLGIAIRNVIYLNGPKAGPQIPDLLDAINQILAILGDPQANVPGRP